MAWGFQVGALAGCGYDVRGASRRRCGSSAWGRGAPSSGSATAGWGGLGWARGTRPLSGPAVVVSGADVAYTSAMNDAMLERFGAGTLAELLLPESVARLRSLFSDAMYKKLWFPERLLSDFLKVMYANRQERKEMLEKLVMMDKQESAPVFQQNILMLWGEDDDFFPIENAKMLKEKLGEKAMLRSISKAGHLAQLERPCVYNHCLKEFLATISPEP
uniref:AB hydrolase-1 domain-containing protein n=1 Tax=Aegilops tauschii TaxID=37682 RepID=M8CCX3_AEGTA